MALGKLLHFSEPQFTCEDKRGVLVYDIGAHAGLVPFLVPWMEPGTEGKIVLCSNPDSAPYWLGDPGQAS